MDHKERKNTPIYSGVVRYFPDALREVARVSKAGNDQHNPGQPLHWAKEKSTDHEDCIIRHLTDHAAGEDRDTDGQLHLAKVAWRALAALQTYLEQQPRQDWDGHPGFPIGVREYQFEPPYRFCSDCGGNLDEPAHYTCLTSGVHRK